VDKIILVLLLTITSIFTSLHASENKTKSLASISAFALFNLDKEMLHNNITAYMNSNPEIQGVTVVDNLLKAPYTFVYKNNQQFIYKQLPKHIQQLQQFKANIIFEEKNIGKLTIYINNGSSLSLTQKEKFFLQNNPSIKVIEFFNEPPFTINQGVKKSGYMYELLQEMANLSGFQIEYIKNFNSFNNMVKSLEDGTVDVQPTFLANYPLQKDSSVKKTKTILRTPFVVIGRSDSPKYKSINDLKGKKVAVVKGYAQDRYLSKIKDVIKVHVKHNDDGFKVLKEGKVDFYINNNANSQYIITKTFSDDLKILDTLPYDIFPPLNFVIGINGKKPELVSILNKALEQIPVKKIQNIQEKWLLKNNTIQDLTKIIPLTQKEKEWLNKHKEIKFTGDPNWLPYEAFTKNGTYKGIVADHLKLIEKRLGITFKTIKPTSWDDAVKKAINKEVDMISEVVAQNTISTTMSYTKPYIETPLIVVMKKDNKNQFVNDLNIIKDKKIAYVSGYGYTEDLKKSYPNIKFYEVKTIKEGLEKTSMGQLDAFVCTLTIGSYNISELGLSNIAIVGKLKVVMNLGFGIRNDWPIFVNILNKTINSITTAESRNIKQQWIGKNTLANLDLSVKEKAWLEKKQTIKYVYDVNWAPFEWKNELGEHTGIIFDILSLIEQKSGIKFQAVPTQKWSEAVGLMKSDKADMYSGMGENPERKKYLNFTKNNIFKTPYVFVSRADDKNDYLETFKVIQNKKVAVVQGYTIHGILKENIPKLPLLTVNNIKEGFEKVSNKEIDIFIVNAATAKYFINRKGYNNLQIATKTEFNLELKVALQKEMPKEALCIIDKALKSISEKETSDIYFKWTEILVKPKTDWIFFYKIGGAVLIVILIIIYWNRRLKKAVDEKTSELQKLLSSFDENVIASKSDLKGNITYASDALSQISQYSKEELIGQPHSIIKHSDMPKEIFEDLWSTIKKGQTWKGEIKNRKKDGSYYWVDAVITPEFNEKLELVGYSAIRQDITDKKKVEELSESLELKVIERTKELDDERKYINAIMNSQTNIVISSDGKCLRTANQAFLDFFDVRDTDDFIELYGDCICDTFDTDRPNQYIQKMMGEEKWLDYVYQRPNQIHKAKITRKEVEHIFTITADKFTFDNEELKTAVFTDITDLEKIRQEMETIHRNTQSSIEYAALIQHSIVPENTIFNKYFEDFLAIWQPKDIVGGDIYLFEELRNDNECLLMVIDCTGHGVPGAFVTMLVKAIERQISAIVALDAQKEVSPAWVLEYFNKTMKKLLRQESSEAISNAGFDGGILYYNKEKDIVKFAGSETALFYVEDNILKTIKGDRHSIGYKKSDANYKFKDHTIKVKAGMQFYLTTDGYLDQNGGEKGFPFGKKRFKAILEENHKESLADQQEILLDTLQEYQGDEERNDDMTVIGVKIGNNKKTETNQEVNWSI